MSDDITEYMLNLVRERIALYLERTNTNLDSELAEYLADYTADECLTTLINAGKVDFLKVGFSKKEILSIVSTLHLDIEALCDIAESYRFMTDRPVKDKMIFNLRNLVKDIKEKK